MNRGINCIDLSEEKLFESIFQQLNPFLLMYAKRFGFAEVVAKDIVQESFIALWETREIITSLPKAHSFLYTCVRNNALNLLNRKKVEERYLNQIKYEFLNQECTFFMAEDEFSTKFNEAIAALPAKMQKVIRLTLDGTPVKDIAFCLDVATETVYSHRQLAYQKLRNLL